MSAPIRNLVIFLLTLVSGLVIAWSVQQNLDELSAFDAHFSTEVLWSRWAPAFVCVFLALQLDALYHTWLVQG